MKIQDLSSEFKDLKRIIKIIIRMLETLKGIEMNLVVYIFIMWID